MPRVLLAALSAALLVPSAASAALSTSITSPAPDARIVVSEDVPQSLHVEGTATETAAVDVVCAWRNTANVTFFDHVGGTGENVPVTGGAFALDVPAPSAQRACRLIAIDHGTTPTTLADVSYASGPRLLVAEYRFIDLAGKHRDYYAWLSGTIGAFDFDSLGGCTLDDSYLVQGSVLTDVILYCNGWMDFEDPHDTTKPGILVDGKPAYPTSAMSESQFTGATSWTPVTLDVTDDGSRFSLHSTETLWRCATGSEPDAFPSTAAKCGDVASSGVALVVDESMAPDGRTLTQHLRFTSADGREHTLAGPIHQDTSPSGREFLFPGEPAFTTFAGGAGPSQVAPGVASILTRVPGATDPDPAHGQAAITYVVTPGAETFYDTTSRYFTMDYPARTIPAGKAIRFDFVYTDAAGSAELAPLRAAAEASFTAPPSIAFTSPTAASSVQATLSGKVTSPEPLNAVTVNDVAVPFGDDGTFTVSETLVANTPTTFAVKATDELGRTAGASQVITFSQSNPPPPATPASVRFSRSGKPKLKGRAVTTGLTASCPGVGPACSISARAKAGRKAAGKGSATVRAGATAKVKLRLTKAAAKLLKRKHKLKLTLKLTGKRTGATTTTANRTLKLSLRR